MPDAVPRRRTEWDVADHQDGFWRSYSTDEDKDRINSHYDRPAEFFITLTGGEWNVYSCNLWESARTDTESQEHKLDLLAEMLDLRPGERVLDVGCGWGGPLVYLAKRYGVNGTGITPSPRQAEYANRRASAYGVPVAFYVQHWREVEENASFDAIYSDEVIVHFSDLGGFFAKARDLLKPGGRMLNKELHFASSRFMQVTRGMVFINKLAGETGHYRMLHDELSLLDRAGFDILRIEQMALPNYQRTLDGWLANIRESQHQLEALVGADDVRHFRTYLKVSRKSHGGPSMTLDLVLARSPGRS
jgi:cyclopropane-fatty-acyl-phospholipid synthase